MASPKSTPKPTPILFTLPNLVTAGSGRALFEVARRLDRREFEPMLCLGARGGSLEREFERCGIPVFEGQVTLPAAPRGSLLLRARRAARELKALPRGAIWHSFHYLDDYTEPIVARFAGCRAWVYTKKNMSWNDRSWQLRSLGARRVLAQNHDMMSSFFGGRWRRRARYVPRGVDTERFAPRHEAKSGPTADPTAPLRLGCVAHLVPVKGHPTLLEAVARAPGVRLDIAGKTLDEGYVEGLRQQITDLGLEQRARLVGPIRDVPGFLHELDLFVLPTWAKWRQEGCPVALLEAMASGLPVIATDIPGSRDVIEPERSGLLVPPEDAEALAGAIQRFRNGSLRRRLGEGARQRVLERFSIEHEVSNHEALYREILGW